MSGKMLGKEPQEFFSNVSFYMFTVWWVKSYVFLLRLSVRSTCKSDLAASKEAILVHSFRISRRSVLEVAFIA